MRFVFRFGKNVWLIHKKKFNVVQNTYMRSLVLFLLVICAAHVWAQDRPYTFVSLNSNPDAAKITKEESDKLMEGHMANINKLASEGKLLAAGPFEGGGGIFILNTKSSEEAASWLGTDPGVQAKRWRIEYLPYQPRIGSVCPVSEDYEMVDYIFIRYKPLISKFNAGTYPALLENHDNHIRQNEIANQIVTEGSFDDEGNSILILKMELPSGLLESDPAVQEGLMTMEVKKLYIARGSFCEN